VAARELCRLRSKSRFASRSSEIGCTSASACRCAIRHPSSVSRHTRVTRNELAAFAARAGQDDSDRHQAGNRRRQDEQVGSGSAGVLRYGELRGARAVRPPDRPQDPDQVDLRRIPADLHRTLQRRRKRSRHRDQGPDQQRDSHLGSGRAVFTVASAWYRCPGVSPRQHPPNRRRLALVRAGGGH
jgi:hypothetical protein